MTTPHQTLIHDAGDLRKYRTEIPNIVFLLGLSPFELALYAHLKKTAGARAGGRCEKATSLIAQEAGMSKSTVSEAKQSLARKGRPALGGKALIEIAKDETLPGRPRDIITIVDIWPENFAYFSTSAPAASSPTRSPDQEEQSSLSELQSSPQSSLSELQSSLSEPNKESCKESKKESCKEPKKLLQERPRPAPPGAMHKPSAAAQNAERTVQNAGKAAAAVMPKSTIPKSEDLPHAVDPIAFSGTVEAVLSALTAQGVPPDRATVERLLRRYEPERVLRQVRWLPRRSGRNISVLVAAVRDDYEPPPDLPRAAAVPRDLASQSEARAAGFAKLRPASNAAAAPALLPTGGAEAPMSLERSDR